MRNVSGAGTFFLLTPGHRHPGCCVCASCAPPRQHYGIENVIENNIFHNVNRGDFDAAINSGAHDRPGDEGDTR